MPGFTSVQFHTYSPAAEPVSNRPTVVPSISVTVIERLKFCACKEIIVTMQTKTSNIFFIVTSMLNLRFVYLRAPRIRFAIRCRGGNQAMAVQSHHLGVFYVSANGKRFLCKDKSWMNLFLPNHQKWFE